MKRIQRNMVIDLVPGRWWLLYDEKDNLLAETSNPDDILKFHIAGAKIFNVYVPRDVPEVPVKVSLKEVAVAVKARNERQPIPLD